MVTSHGVANLEAQGMSSISDEMANHDRDPYFGAASEHEGIVIDYENSPNGSQLIYTRKR